MKTLRTALINYGLPIATAVVLIAIWEAAVRIFNLPQLYLPAPSLIGEELWRWKGTLLFNTGVTLAEALLGFALGVAGGIPLALAITYSPLLQRTIYPLIVISQSIPKVAVAPLFLVWLGYGLETKVMIGFLVTFFPIVVNTSTGLASAEPELLDLVRSLGGSRLLEFRKIRFPHAMPFMFAGFKVSITLAVIGAIIGEFVASDQGLGYVILVASAQLKIGLVFACLAWLSVMGITLFAIIEWLERVVIPWNFIGEAQALAGATK